MKSITYYLTNFLTFIIMGSLLIIAPHSPKLHAETPSPSIEILHQNLKSIVIIDSERISYANPYKTAPINNLFFPIYQDTFKKSKNDIQNAQGNGVISKKLFGSGVILRKAHNTYYILTNYHVIEQSTSIWVTTHDGSIHRATFIGSDEKRDIAVISIETETPYTLITLAQNPTFDIGTPIYVIGSPYGFTFSVSKGIISSTNRTDNVLNNIFIQTDAAMNPGNSGGALVNEQGELLGMSTWIYSPQSSLQIGINFASTIDIALSIADTIISHGSIAYGWVGLTYAAFPPATLNSMNISQRFGSIITNLVLEDSALEAGLHIGDVILAINDNHISSFNALLNNTAALISTLPPDTMVPIEVQRNGEILTLSVHTKIAPTLEQQAQEIVPRIWPGMTVVPIEHYKKEILGLTKEQQVLQVHNLIKDSYAYESFFEENDIITGINNAEATYKNYIFHINNAIKTRTPITFEIFSSGEYFEETLRFDQ